MSRRDLGLLCRSAWQALREMFHDVATDPSARPGAENREKFLLPAGIRDVRVENRGLVVSSR